MISTMTPLRRFVPALVVLALAAPSANAQTESSASADLAVTTTEPAATPLVGDIFQVVYSVTNAGPDTASEATLSIYMSQEVELRSIASSDPNDTCGEEPPPQPEPARAEEGDSGGGATPARVAGSLNCSLGSVASGEQTAITLSLQRVGARESWISGWVSSPVNDPDYSDNSADIQLAADKSRPADVGVTISAPKSPDVGGEFSYTMTVSNNGPSTADTTTLNGSVPYGTTLVSVTPARPSDTCTVTEYPDDFSGYSEIACDLGPLSPGGSTTVTLTVTRSSAYEIYNSAWVTTSNYDANYDNDFATHQVAADPSVTSDLAVRMTGPATTPLVGEDFTYAITVSNHGPAQAGDVTLSDFLPPGVTFVSVSPADRCSYNSGDGGGTEPAQDQPASSPPPREGAAYYPIYSNAVSCNLGALAVETTAEVAITVTRTHAREIWNSAWVSSSNHDPDFGNNYTDALVDPDKSKPADVGVEMSAPENPPVDTDFDFTITVTNEGPSAADAVTLIDHLPYGVDFVSVSSSDATDVCAFTESSDPPPPYEGGRPIFYGFREVRCDMGSLAPGASDTVTITVTRRSEYEIWNSASVAISNYDGNYENDYASVLVAGKRYEGECPQSGTVEGGGGSDDIVVGDCAVESKAGADSVEVAPPSGARAATVSTGRGADVVTVNLTIGSTERRTIEVHAGRGADRLFLNVSPGAGNATVTLDGGRGNDSITVTASAGVTGLRIIALGGRDDDSVQWYRAAGSPPGPVTGMRVRGGDGSDLLQGGDGPDRLRGGSGRDRLYGGLGDDYLNGGLGNDICRAGPGRDTREAC